MVDLKKDTVKISKHLFTYERETRKLTFGGKALERKRERKKEVRRLTTMFLALSPGLDDTG